MTFPRNRPQPLNGSKTINLVIFDLDGTLIDSLPDITDSINHMRSDFDLPQLTFVEVRNLVGKGARNLVERALPGYDAVQVNRGLELFLAHNHAHIVDKTTMYSGVEKTLQALCSRGLLLVVLSNKNVALCREALSRFGLDCYFAEVMGGDSIPFRKPSPEPILKLMRDFGFSAKETVIVGDSINDMDAGKNAGVVTIGCTYGYGDDSELVSADYILHSFPDLLELPVFQYT